MKWLKRHNPRSLPPRTLSSMDNVMNRFCCVDRGMPSAWNFIWFVDSVCSSKSDIPWNFAMTLTIGNIPEALTCVWNETPSSTSDLHLLLLSTWRSNMSSQRNKTGYWMNCLKHNVHIVCRSCTSQKWLELISQLRTH